MTDRYENIRKALARVCDPGAHPKRYTQERYTQALTKLRLACDPDTIRALLAERDALEAAREDAERLDWLASESPPLWVSRDRGGYELPYFDITSGRECCDPGDLRAAIDQARGKENANG